MTTLPRLHLFELEDQSWFLTTIRDLATDYIHFLETKLALHAPVVPLISEELRFTGAAPVVNLCSGGGEAMQLRRHTVPHMLALLDGTRLLVKALEGLAVEGHSGEAMAILDEELRVAPVDANLRRLRRKLAH